MKICCKCGLEKPETSFSKNIREKDGLKRYCKECVSKASALYRETHRGEVNARKRISYEKSKLRAAERTAKQAKALHKVCSICNVDKPLSEFYLCGNGGYRSYCISCANAKASEYHSKNKGRLTSRKKEYNKMHKERIDSYNHSYYQTHTDEVKRRVKRWIKANPEQARDNSVMSRARLRSIAEGLPATFTRKEWLFCKGWFSTDGITHCAYCGKEIHRATQDHVIPVSKGGEYSISNIVPACRNCNSSKSSKNMNEWYRIQPFYSSGREKNIYTYLEATRQYREGHESGGLCNA